MAKLLKFILVLILGLGLLAWLAFRAVTETTQAWFEKDVDLRAKLAVNSARPALLNHWKNDGDALQKTLTELTHDERIMGAAACDGDFALRAATDEFPSQLTCQALGPKLRTSDSATVRGWQAHQEGLVLPRGNVHVNAVPIEDSGSVVGFVVLVHDLAFVERREAKARHLILIAFGVLAVTAPVVTLIAARLFWKGWTQEIRQFLRGGVQHREFQPILRDVRELVERVSAERALNQDAGPWTPGRLRNTLTQYNHGEKVIVVANREPYIHEKSPDGAIHVLHPASGLVTAMEPVLRACGGVWVAHGGGSGDRQTVDRFDRIRVPPGEESYTLRRVWLSAEEEQGFYYGFSNEGLWPLCHIADTRPVFRRGDWGHYLAVNRKFAETVCAEADSEDPIVLVQDYHFAVAPRMIREKLPKATIITFWHIPWPNSERFGICPWHEELLQGMLGSTILGFQTRFHCNNFLEAVDRFLEARIDRESIAVIHERSHTIIRDYPISIEWPSSWAAQAPPPAECRASVTKEFNLQPDALLGVGVDRLDYTKGIEERLGAVERLLERNAALRGRFTFLQLAAPSRTVIERYRQLNESVEQLADRINLRFAKGSYQPVILRRAHHEPPAVFRYYRAADLCYVSSLHDGMNLVAKEFVASREDEQGVLVLSHFTGASRELTEALIVNPYDLDEAAAALEAALKMPQGEQRDRMRAMRYLLADFNVYRWAGRMLIDAARQRRRNRFTDRT